MYVTKMTERYNEPLKIEKDIHQGGSVRVCEKYDHNLGCNWRPLRTSISSSFRRKEKLKNGNVKEHHSIFGNTIPNGSGRLLLRYFAFSLVFDEQVLVQLVFARPAMEEVPRSMPKCDLQSLFRLLSFPCSFK